LLKRQAKNRHRHTKRGGLSHARSSLKVARRVIDAGAYWLRQLHSKNARKILRMQATGYSHAAYI
jgi:hypothetical protein